MLKRLFKIEMNFTYSTFHPLSERDRAKKDDGRSAKHFDRGKVELVIVQSPERPVPNRLEFPGVESGYPRRRR